MKARLLVLGLMVFLMSSCGSGKKEETSNKDLLEAKRLLTEAGYPDGKGFPKSSLLYNTSEAHEKVAVAIQNMWKRNLGVEVELRNAEWKTYLDQLSKLDYQIARRGWIGDYNDPNTFLEMFLSGGGNNNTGWANPEYDKLIHASLAEQDAQKRRTLRERAEAILMKDVCIIPIYFYVTQEMHRDDVKGWYQNLQAIHPLKYAHRTDGKMLVINNHAEIQTVDPGIARGVPEHRVQIGLYEGLLSYDPKTVKPVPGVAERWEVSADGKAYTFYLRACQWSDGKPVTAQDFEYAWKRVLNPATAADYAHQLHYIKGAKAYNTGEVKDPGTVAVRASDARTLVVELENPLSFFLDLMPFFTFYPVRKDLIEKFGNKWTLPENHVGNGPFKLKQWVVNDHILLEKNERYWDAANVKQKLIKFLPTQNATTAFNLYEKQECHILTSVPLEFVEKIKARPDYHSDTYLGTYYYSFNVKQKPFDDIRVRRAFALAIDRSIITEKITRGGQHPAFHFVPPVFPGFKHTKFNQVNAK